MSPVPDIELHDIAKSFGKTQALSDLSLSICRGELLALIGPSGCGKTTLLKIIAGVEEQDDGELYISGTHSRDLPASSRNVTMLWQSLALFPHMTVEQNVEFGLLMHGVERRARLERVNSLLNLLGLEGYQKRRIKGLSGGEQQRVALARALAPEPKILLLDEPFGSVDFNLSLKLQAEISRLHKQLNVTFVLVTHSRAEALSLADRIAVMRAGRIEQVGTAAQILYEPRTQFVAEFAGFSNIIPTKIVGADQDEIHVTSAFGTFHGRLSASTELNPILGADAAYGIPHYKIVFDNHPKFPNRISGKCIAKRVVGSGVFYLVQIDRDTVLTIEHSSASDSIGPGVGEMVDLAWDSQSAVIMTVT